MFFPLHTSDSIGIMHLRRIPYWVKGGLLVVVLAALFFMGCSIFLHQIYGDMMMIFAFPFWIAGFDVAVRGTPAPMSEAIVKVGLGILSTVGIYFLLGALLGGIYGSIKYRKAFLIVSVCIFIGIPIFIASSKLRDFNKMTIQGITKPEECETYADQSSKSRCYSGYYRMFPPEPAICEKMIPASDYAFERKECSRGVGAMTNDVDLCHQFHDPIEQKECLDGFGKYGPYDPYAYPGGPENPYVRRK